MKKWRMNTEEATINLTPLIDVVFVVLIMFIVLAPLLDVDRISLAQSSPSSENIKSSDHGSIALHVYPDDTLTLNHEKIALHSLETELKRLKSKRPDSNIELYQDQSATFGCYQSIKNAVERAGFGELLVVLKP